MKQTAVRTADHVPTSRFPISRRTARKNDWGQPVVDLLDHRVRAAPQLQVTTLTHIYRIDRHHMRPPGENVACN